MKEIKYKPREMDRTTFVKFFLERFLRALDQSITNISLINTAELKELLRIERADGETVIDITKKSNFEITQEALSFIEN